MVIVPPKYYSPTRLKDLLLQDNPFFKNLSMSVLLKYKPFDNIDRIGPIIEDLTNPIDIYLMYRLLDKYYYSEIGFDIDELFIDRFINRWNTLSPMYIAKLTSLADFNIDERQSRITIDIDKIFNRNVEIHEERDLTVHTENDLTDTHDLTFGKGVTQTTTNDLTDTAVGDNTEYQMVTKDVSGTTTRKGTVTVANSGNDTETGTIKKGGSVDVKDGGNKDVVTTETNFNSDKFAVMDMIESIIKDFIQNFQNLFMGVFTHI